MGAPVDPGAEELRRQLVRQEDHDVGAGGLGRLRLAGNHEKGPGALADMRRRLQAQLSIFEHPYDMADQPFMRSDRYREMADRTRAIGTAYIGWLPRDHGRIVWPPEPASAGSPAGE